MPGSDTPATTLPDHALLDLLRSRAHGDEVTLTQYGLAPDARLSQAGIGLALERLEASGHLEALERGKPCQRSGSRYRIRTAPPLALQAPDIRRILDDVLPSLEPLVRGGYLTLIDLTGAALDSWVDVSMSDLARAFGPPVRTRGRGRSCVSRETVRRVMRTLDAQGLIQWRPGRGRGRLSRFRLREPRLRHSVLHRPGLERRLTPEGQARLAEILDGGMRPYTWTLQQIRDDTEELLARIDPATLEALGLEPDDPHTFERLELLVRVDHFMPREYWIEPLDFLDY